MSTKRWALVWIWLIQAVLILTLLGDSLGVKIFYLRQIVAFIYLTFIPGFLILGILKVDGLNNLEKFLFSVGLSLMFIMTFGFILQLTSQILRFNPFGSIYMIIFILLVSILCLIYYKRAEETFSTVGNISLDNLNSTLFAFLLPSLSVTGVLWLLNYDQNIILLLLIFIIALAPFTVAYKKIPPNMYPLILFSIAFSLILHKTLISPYLWLGDSAFEYTVGKTVLVNGFWNIKATYDLNSLLSLTILHPTYSIFLDVELAYILKYVYAFLLALLPVAMYEMFKPLFKRENAFYASFFFISFYPFYGEMLTLSRQGISEFFLVLFFILLLKDYTSFKTNLLIVIFAVGVIWSHYGVSYIMILILLALWLFGSIIPKFHGPPQNDRKLSGFFFKFIPGFHGEDQMEDQSLTLNLTILFTVFSIAWYLYVGGSESITSIALIANNIFINIMDVFSPLSEQPIISNALGLGQMHSAIWNIGRYIQVASQVFIVLGSLIWMKKKGLSGLYSKLIMVGLFLLVLSIIVPNFVSSMSISRVYSLVLILLAPCCILGLKYLAEYLLKHLKIDRDRRKAYLKLILASFLAVYLIFQCGFVFEITQDYPSSYALSKQRIDTSTDSSIKINFAYFTNRRDAVGSHWLLSHITGDRFMIFTDMLLRFHFVEGGLTDDVISSISYINPTLLKGKTSYVVFGKLSTQDGITPKMINENLRWVNTQEVIQDNLDGTHQIYINGYLVVYIA